MQSIRADGTFGKRQPHAGHLSASAIHWIVAVPPICSTSTGPLLPHSTPLRISRLQHSGQLRQPCPAADEGSCASRMAFFFNARHSELHCQTAETRGPPGLVKSGRRYSVYSFEVNYRMMAWDWSCLRSSYDRGAI